jgi:hypothetical protein
MWWPCRVGSPGGEVADRGCGEQGGGTVVPFCSGGGVGLIQSGRQRDALGGNDGGGVCALRRSGAVVTCRGGDG